MRETHRPLAYASNEPAGTIGPTMSLRPFGGQQLVVDVAAPNDSSGDPAHQLPAGPFAQNARRAGIIEALAFVMRAAAHSARQACTLSCGSRRLVSGVAGAGP